jgi:hypothetical protein
MREIVKKAAIEAVWSGAIVAVFIAASLVSVNGHADAAGPCSVSVRAGGTVYTGAVTRSVRTSCPFARNVTRASLRYIIAAGGSGDGDFYTHAWSPITHREYRVHCQADGDLNTSYGMRVTCRAGHSARVSYTGRAK